MGAQTGGVWRQGLPDGGRAAARLRAWAPARWPLSARLTAAVFCLVATGGGAITAATHLVARDYLTRQADQQLRSYAAVLTSRPFTLFPGFRVVPGASGLGAARSSFSIAVRASGGQLLISAGPATPPAASGSWLEISEPVRYRAEHIPFVYGADDSSISVTSKSRPGSAGTLVIGLDLAGAGRAVDGLTTICLMVSGVAALVVTCAAAGVTRTLLRPAALAAGTEAAGTEAGTEAAGTGAGTEAAGTEAGTEAAGTGAGIQAGAEAAGAEAGARDATERTGALVARACQAMRRPLSVMAGMADYYRSRGELGSDDAEAMVLRVAHEAARVAALADVLEAASRDEPRPR